MKKKLPFLKMPANLFKVGLIILMKKTPFMLVSLPLRLNNSPNSTEKSPTELPLIINNSINLMKELKTLK